MKLLKHVLKRIFIVAVPLLALYFFSTLAFEENRQK